MPPVASDEGNLQNKLKYYFWANLQFKSIPRVLLSSPKNGKIFHLIQECAQLLNDMSAIFLKIRLHCVDVDIKGGQRLSVMKVVSFFFFCPLLNFVSTKKSVTKTVKSKIHKEHNLVCTRKQW